MYLQRLLVYLRILFYFYRMEGYEKEGSTFLYLLGSVIENSISFVKFTWHEKTHFATRALQFSCKIFIEIQTVDKIFFFYFAACTIFLKRRWEMRNKCLRRGFYYDLGKILDI